jgi:Zn/Cd-binding protein ZinT
VDKEVRDKERELDKLRVEKEISSTKAETAELKQREAAAKKSYGGAWRKVLGYVSSMTKSEKLQTLKSQQGQTNQNLRSYNTPRFLHR